MKKLLIFAINSELKQVRKMFLEFEKDYKIDILVNVETELKNSTYVNTKGNKRFVSKLIIEKINELNPDVVYDFNKSGNVPSIFKDKLVSKIDKIEKIAKQDKTKFNSKKDEKEVN